MPSDSRYVLFLKVPSEPGGEPARAGPTPQTTRTRTPAERHGRQVPPYPGTRAYEPAVLRCPASC